MRIWLLGLVVGVAGCGVIGPTCVGRQKTGLVTTIEGDVAAGQIVTHRVRYATEGSQNDAAIEWEGQSALGGPRIGVYATRVGCTDLRLPPATNDDACALLGRAGAIDGQIVTTLIVTNGRGNPDVLGTPAEYLLWIAGDPDRSTRYTIRVTWFYGPDC